MLRRLLLFAAITNIGGMSQDFPRYFELRLPDFYDHPFDGSQTVIELPAGKPLKSLSIVVLKSHQREINNVAIKINGKGMGNVFDQTNDAQGTVYKMTDFSLGMRPDQPLDPLFEYSIEVVAKGRSGGAYYQNWLLRENTSQQNRLFAYTASFAANDDSGGPPDLIIKEPAVPAVIRSANRAAAKIRISGTASGPPATLTINGVPAAFKAAGPAATFEADVPMSRETKVISIEAVSRKGSKRSVAIPVVIEQAAAPRTRFAGKRYALVVGVSDYGEGKKGLPRLPAASTDAAFLAKTLTTSGGFAPENIKVLRDDQARRDEIRLSLTEVASRAGPDDLLLLYIAAHGIHDPGRQDQLYLAPYGAQWGQLASTGIAYDELQTILDRGTRSRNVLLVFDTSHKLNDDLQIPGRNLINNYLLNLFKNEGRTVLVSSAGGQVSRDNSGPNPSSIFAQSVGEALTGQADVNLDRVVTPEELCRFVGERVRRQSDGAQTPRFLVADASRSAAFIDLSSAFKPK